MKWEMNGDTVCLKSEYEGFEIVVYMAREEEICWFYAIVCGAHRYVDRTERPMPEAALAEARMIINFKHLEFML